MSARLIHFNVYCAGCSGLLTLEEMWYFEREEHPGTAHCHDCEIQSQLEARAQLTSLPAPRILQ